MQSGSFGIPFEFSLFHKALENLNPVAPPKKSGISSFRECVRRATDGQFLLDSESLIQNGRFHVHSPRLPI